MTVLLMPESAYGPTNNCIGIGRVLRQREHHVVFAVIPLVDLVITHGGNNTVTETFHFGKPMVLLPLFWDQHDNAQRVHEAGFGVRLDTYTFTEAQMCEALDRLLRDRPLRVRLDEIGKTIRSRNGVAAAALHIEAAVASNVSRPHAEERWPSGGVRFSSHPRVSREAPPSDPPKGFGDEPLPSPPLPTLPGVGL